MPAPMKNYQLTRYILSDGSFDTADDLCYVGRNKVPQSSFFYPGAKITYLCDDHPEREMTMDESGRPTCPVCGRQTDT